MWWKGIAIVGIWSAVAVIGFSGGDPNLIAITAMIGTVFVAVA